VGKESQIRTLTPNFTNVIFKNVDFRPKNRQTWYFYNFAPKGVYPLIGFYKIVSGEGVPGLHYHAKLDHCSFKNVALQSPKSPKMVIFGTNLPLQENFWGQ